MNIEALQDLLTQGQDNLLLRFGLGQALLKTDQVTEAILHLEKALEFDPAHSASMKLLGKAYAADGNSDKAIEVFRQGIQIGPVNASLRHNSKIRPVDRITLLSY